MVKRIILVSEMIYLGQQGDLTIQKLNRITSVVCYKLVGIFQRVTVVQSDGPTARVSERRIFHHNNQHNKHLSNCQSLL